jgi:DNA-binding MarR family transcriptional regulator
VRRGGTWATQQDRDLELASRLRLVFARVGRILRQQAASGLTLSQQSALASVVLRGPLTLGELAQIERVAPPSVTRIVAKLEADGLVERRPDPDDRRVHRVVATAAGIERLEDSRQRRNAWLTSRLAALPPEDVARLRDAVDVLEGLAGPDTDLAAPTGSEAPQ